MEQKAKVSGLSFHSFCMYITKHPVEAPKDDPYINNYKNMIDPIFSSLSQGNTNITPDFIYNAMIVYKNLQEEATKDTSCKELKKYAEEKKKQYTDFEKKLSTQKK